jgi:hypothetical protein
MWKLYNTFLNDELIKEESKREIKSPLEMVKQKHCVSKFMEVSRSSFKRETHIDKYQEK